MFFQPTCELGREWISVLVFPAHLTRGGLEKLIQCRPLVWSTDVRSTRLYGQFLVGPEQNGLFISVKACFKIKNARLYGQIYCHART